MVSKDKIKRFFSYPAWLIAILLVAALLRVPSLFETYSYGDEMIYLTLGNGVRHGLTLYKDLHDNKPPLLYYVAAIGGTLFWFKAILFIWSLITIFLFWKLVNKAFPKRRLSQQIAVAFFAVLTTIPLLEGNIANAENFLIGFTILGFLIIFDKTNSKTSLFFSGACFGIAALFKIPASFDLIALFLFLILKFLLSTKRKKIYQLFLHLFLITIGFLTPIFITFIWYWYKGALENYFHAAFLQNVGYLSSWRPDSSREPFLIKNAPLLTRAAIATFGSLMLLLFNKKLTKTFLFASIWLLWAAFAATLSERPYPHYLLQLVAPVSILIAILAKSPKIDQVITILPLGIAVFIPVYYKYYYYQTASYYERFLLFATKQISQEAYLNKFDGAVSRNYKIAQNLRERTNNSDKVFVFGDSPPIYALSQRLPSFKYTAYYHIADFSSLEKTLYSLESDNPSFIVVLNTKDDASKKFLKLASNLLSKKYILLNTIEDAQIWKLVNPRILGIISTLKR